MAVRTRSWAFAAGIDAVSEFLQKPIARLELASAKHRSLAGHARIARRIASLIPFYEYGEERFFCSDDAP